MYSIPIYQPSLSGNEKKYVLECLDSSWISSKGKFIEEFENEFSKFIKTKYATAVSNGTVAIHLALVALGIGEGDEVLVPTLTYIASVNAISYTGATPIFVDADKETWQININDIERKITSKTKAIMAVHLYGYPCNMIELKRICTEHNLFLIEDCAEAIGTKFNGNHVGTFGDIATFSFFGNKTITTGEGGMVVTNDETLIQRARHYKGQGLAKYRQYWHDVIGFNYRMTNIQAAIGLAQLEQAATFIEKKQFIAKYYQEKLANTSVTFHTSNDANAFHSYWMCSILVNDAAVRDKFRDYLENAGIETRPVFYPVHTMPMYSKKFEKHRIAEDIAWRGINIPSYPDLTIEQLDFVIDKIKEACSHV